MLSSKSREHLMRVLENQEKIAAELARTRQRHGDGQMHMPLIAEVKLSGVSKQRPRRSRTLRKLGQPEFNEF